MLICCIERYPNIHNIKLWDFFGLYPGCFNISWNHLTFNKCGELVLFHWTYFIFLSCHFKLLAYTSASILQESWFGSRHMWCYGYSEFDDAKFKILWIYKALKCWTAILPMNFYRWEMLHFGTLLGAGPLVHWAEIFFAVQSCACLYQNKPHWVQWVCV